jgi:hypothetical protein
MTAIQFGIGTGNQPHGNALETGGLTSADSGSQLDLEICVKRCLSEGAA